MKTRNALTGSLIIVISLATMIFVMSYSKASPIDPVVELPIPTAPPAPSVPKRTLVIHGPFVVNSNELTAGGNTAVAADENPSVTNSGTAGKRGGKGEPSGPQTPKADVTFLDTTGLAGIDPGIAAGTNSLMVSDNQTGLAVYSKDGSLLSAKPGQTFANPFSAASLFSKLLTDANKTLNLPPGLPAAPVGGPAAINAKIKGLQAEISQLSKSLNGAPLDKIPLITKQMHEKQDQIDDLSANASLCAFGDVRVMFDSYRKRFWIYAMMKSSLNWTPDRIMKYPALKLARRDKAAVAVSKTEDPRDGFYTYWWNETINNGDCNVPTGCSDPVFKTSGEGADYPAIGISPKYFLSSIGVNRRDPAFKTDTADSAQTWIDCRSPFQADGRSFPYCGPFYVNLTVVDAEALSSGCARSGSQCASGNAFGLFVDSKNFVTDRTELQDFTPIMGRGVKPVVMHGPQQSDGYFVNNFIDRPWSVTNQAEVASLQDEISKLSKSLNGAALDKIPSITNQIQEKQSEVAELKKTRYELVVWSLEGGNLVPTLYPIKPFTFDTWNDWHFVLNASARDGKLYATFNQCYPNADGCPLGVRVLRVNTSNGKTEIDRTFGLNSSIDDKSSDLYHYSFPGIEANKSGDMVMVYRRFSVNGDLRPEVRFSVWYPNEADIRPSRLLKSSEVTYPAQAFMGTDTAGIAVDPTDDETIWMAQIIGVNGSDGHSANRIVVGKLQPAKSQSGQ